LDEIFGTRLSVSPPVLIDTNKNDEPTNSLGGPLQIKLDIESRKTVSPPCSPSCTDPEESSTEATCKTGVAPKKNTRRLGEKRPAEVGISALANAAKLRFDAQMADVELNREKFEDEKSHKKMLLDLEHQRFEFEKVMALEKMKLEEKKISNELELGKFKIQKEMELQMELAKLSK